MKKFNVLSLIFALCVFLGPISSYGQVNYTAHDRINPYSGSFGYGVNFGGYGTSSNLNVNGQQVPWLDQELAEIAAGNPAEGILGAGVKSIRLSLPEWFVEKNGYDIRLDAFQRYAELGLKDHTVFLNGPSDEHLDYTEYCPGKPSTIFKNLHLPIWDGGANGTPYTDENYYAKYVYEVVSRYGKWVKYWEVWNEPDFTSSTNNVLDPGLPGSWWSQDPNPCDLSGGGFGIQAPISHYVRMLRITYEIVKTLYPDSYVALGGIGYPSFLDAILRNTDNPNNGDVSGEYALKGGAYFDVLSWHYYPHVDEAFKIWNQNILGFDFKRYSDAGYDGFLQRAQEYNAVLASRGYDGSQYPAKLQINTETNVPRVPLAQFNSGGGNQLQANYVMKSMLAAQQSKLDHLHIYHIGETWDENNVWELQHQWFMMGLYKNLLTQNKNTAEHTDAGIGLKTMSDALNGYWYDQGKTNQLNLPNNVRGGAFSNVNGETTYMLWARTFRDQSEEANATYTFPSNLSWTSNSSTTLTKREWDFFRTNISTSVSFTNVALNGNPIFLTLNSTVSPCDGLTVTVNSEGPTCFGYTNGTISVSANNGVQPYTFKWEDGSGSPLRNNLVAGTYFVTVTDGNQCSVNQVIQLNSPPPMNATIQVKNETVAGLYDGSLTAFASGGTPGYNYYWSNNTTGQTNQGLTAGTYSLTVNDTKGCPVFKDVILESDDIGCGTFSVNTFKTDLSCFNSNNGTISANPTGGTGNISFQWNTGAITGFIDNLSAGTYRVTTTDELGCTAVATTIINSPEQLSLFVSAGNITIAGANDGSASAFVNGGSTPYTYEWSNLQNTPTINDLNAGVYSITVIDANGCQAIGQTEVISPVPNCEDFEISIVSNGPSCPGANSGFVSANPVNGTAPYQYNWSTGSQTQTIGNLPAGTYFVTMTDANQCVTQSAQTLIAKAPIVINPIVTNATGNSTADGTATLQVNGGTPSYRAEWSSGDSGLFVTGLLPGAYSVTIYDANNCVQTDQVIVGSDSDDCTGFSDVLWQSENVRCASQNNGAILLLPQGGEAPFTYNWSNGANTQGISNLFAGNFTVTVLDANGCPHIRTISITQPQPLTGAINTDLSGDCGDIVDLSAGGVGGTPPYSYQWSNGSLSPNQSGLPAGFYSVTISDANDCTFNQEFNFQEDNSYPGISQVVGEVQCNGEANGYVDLEVQSGVAPFTYNWSNGSTNQDVGDLSAGVYEVMVTDANGCESEHLFIVSQPNPLEFEFDVINPSSEDEKGSIRLEVFGGVGNYTYLWDFGANTSVINNVDVGTYSVTVTDGNGCAHSESVTLGVANTAQNIVRDKAINLYPNPSSDYFFIELAQDELMPTNISLYDIHGKLIKQNNFTHQEKLIKIDVENIVSGTYLVQIQFEDGYSLAKRVMLLNN